MLEQGSNHTFANATPLMTRGDADFVDPQLRRFVWMDVVDAGGKSDHLSLIDRHGQMVVRVAEKLGHQARIDVMIEDAWCDVAKHRPIAGIES